MWSYHKMRYFLSERDIPDLEATQGGLREAAVS